MLKVGGQRINTQQIESAYGKYQTYAFGVPVDKFGNNEIAALKIIRQND